MARGATQACSVEKLQGRYVFTGQGTNLHYGAFDFDGTGKFSGKQTSLRYKASLAARGFERHVYAGCGLHGNDDPRTVNSAVRRTGTSL